MASQRPSLDVGDEVLRICGDYGPERLRISALTPSHVIAGPWRFDRQTLTEVDDFGNPGDSYLVLADARSLLDAMAASAPPRPLSHL